MEYKYISGHESFYLREGWIRKGLNALYEDKFIFKKSNLIKAIDQLGVGSNMVSSLKYWLEILNLIEKNNKDHSYKISAFGTSILELDGYLQNKNTLWLLHFKLSDNSPIWSLVYREIVINVYNRESMLERIMNRFKEEGVQYSDRTIKTSINVFLETYSWDKSIKDPENNIRSPLAKLKVIVPLSKSEFKFRPIEYTEISPYCIYYILVKNTKKKKIQFSEAISLIKNYIRMEIKDFRQSLKQLEYENIISVDRAAGLDNIILKKNLSLQELENLILNEKRN